jgi:hypothetical protein
MKPKFSFLYTIFNQAILVYEEPKSTDNYPYGNYFDNWNSGNAGLLV